MSIVKICIVSILVLGLGGCTSIQTQRGASLSIQGRDYGTVYGYATRAAMSAGMTLVDADKESGFIVARSSGNPFLVSSAPVINIQVLDETDSVGVYIKSTVHGQLIDYGTTEATIERFCSSFQTLVPDSQCLMD